MRIFLIKVAVVLSVTLMVLSATSAFAATQTWTNTGGDNLWSNPANWSGGVPGSSDIALFNATSLADCTLDAAVNVSQFDIEASYSGTIIQNPGITITVGAGGWDQQGGVFTGGDSNFSVTGGLVVAAGTFASTSGQLYLEATSGFAAATFVHNTGTVRLENKGTFTFSPNDNTFYNFDVWDPNGSISNTITLDSSFTVLGTLLANKPGSGRLRFYSSGNPIVTLHGDLDLDRTSLAGLYYFGDSGMTIRFVGVGNQVISQEPTANIYAKVEIDKPSGIVMIGSDTTFGGHLDITLGDTLDVSPDGGTSEYTPRLYPASAVRH